MIDEVRKNGRLGFYSGIKKKKWDEKIERGK